jgi:hypothetical protein
MRDLTFQMPANPTLSCLDLSRVAQIDLDNVQVHTGNFDVGTISMQTTSSSYGIRTPGNNNGALTRLGVVNVCGFYNGYEVAEHCVGQDITAWACKRGVVFVASNHASSFHRIMVVHCQIGLHFAASEHDTYIQQFNIEHASSGTWVPTYDVDDGSNYARGALFWHVVLAGTGIDSGFLSNGALYLKRERLLRQASIASLTDGATVTINANLGSNFRWVIGGNRSLANPTNPYDGQVVNLWVIQDATGSRTWSLGSKLKFPGGAPALSTGANAKDFVAMQYNATEDVWACSLIKGLV